MKRTITYAICSLAALMLLQGCSTDGKRVTVTLEGGTVTLGKYKGVTIEDVSKEVTDDDIQAVINNLLSAEATMTSVTDRPAQKGDVVNIDFMGMKDDVAFDGGTAEGFDLELGSNSFIDGFEDGLIGAVVGEKRDLNLTFPELYQNADLAGQEVVFIVTVNGISEKLLPELNDDIVSRLTEYTTVDEYMEKLKIAMQVSKDYQLQSLALQAAMEDAEIICNEETLREEFDLYYAQDESRASENSMTMEEFLQYQGMTLDGYKSWLMQQIESYEKQQLMIDAIFQKEKFKISDSDRNKLYESQNMDMETFISTYGDEVVENGAKTLKVMSFLAEKAVYK